MTGGEDDVAGGCVGIQCDDHGVAKPAAAVEQVFPRNERDSHRNRLNFGVDLLDRDSNFGRFTRSIGRRLPLRAESDIERAGEQHGAIQGNEDTTISGRRNLRTNGPRSGMSLLSFRRLYRPLFNAQ